MFFSILSLVILILLNAFFAATEIAFISLNDAKIKKEAKEGSKKAKKIEKMLKEPSKFLATIQIGITFAGFLSSAFASETFADKLAPVLNNLLPSIEIGIWKNISIVIITIILAFFTLIFGELVPKRIAMKKYEKIAYFSIGIIKVISIIAAPFVKLLSISTNIVSKIFGVGEHEEEAVTEEEIKMMLDAGQEKGTIEQEEKEMINKVFEFNDKTVSEIMTHRTAVYAIDANSNINDIFDILDEYKYSRIPVYEGNVDEIIGVLYLKDIFKYKKLKQDIKVKDIVREAYFVSEAKLINELFRELQKNKMQIAIVVDEYGGTSGVVTMEDILEELVGNIFDEYDEYEKEFEQIDDNTFMLSGSLTILEVSKILGIEIPEGEYETISGYLIEEMGRIPDDDEKPIIETEKVTYKIEEYEDKRIVWIKACKNHQIIIEAEQEKE